MSEDRGKDSITRPQRDYISIFEGPNNPLDLKSVGQLGIGGGVELAISPTGEKFVVKTGTGVSPEGNALKGISNLVKTELATLRGLGITPVNYGIIAMGNTKDHDLRIISNYVEGDDIDSAPWEMRRNVAKSLLTYYKSKLFSDEDYLSDLVKKHQYRYGTTKHDKDKKIYLVDIDLGETPHTNEHLRFQRQYVILGEINHRIFEFANDDEERKDFAMDIEAFLKDIDPESFPTDDDSGNAKGEYEKLLKSVNKYLDSSQSTAQEE